MVIVTEKVLKYDFLDSASYFALTADVKTKMFLRCCKKEKNAFIFAIFKSPPVDECPSLRRRRRRSCDACATPATL